MALEQLRLAPALKDGNTNAVTPSNSRQTSVEAIDDGNRAPRLPRWTRQEILVLIQGKKVAENRVRRGRTVGLAFGSNQIEPKWTSVSSYCKRHGVNRGPVQCRKRWSNLAGDFKKIKEWESQKSGEAESFWVMRNDLRRERKLPGFFDREVYDILDGGTVAETEPLTVTVTESTKGNGEGDAATVVAEDELVFDSARTAAADDGLFSDFENKAPLPISEKQHQPICEGYLDQGTANQKQQVSNNEKGSTSQEGRKRRRSSLSDEDGDVSMQDQLIKVLERNGRMVTAQLEAQNVNCQLDRDQRKDYTNNIVAVLGKFVDALGRIADKL